MIKKITNRSLDALFQMNYSCFVRHVLERVLVSKVRCEKRRRLTSETLNDIKKDNRFCMSINTTTPGEIERGRK